MCEGESEKTLNWGPGCLGDIGGADDTWMIHPYLVIYWVAIIGEILDVFILDHDLS